MSKIRKAVIPAAGAGLNFLPATKATAKEMLPIVDKPVMQFVVEEALESGIEELIIITGRHKRSIEDHFDANFELEQNLRAKEKNDLLKIAQDTTLDNIFYVRQPSPLGLGDAVLRAKEFINDEPFAVLLADNIMESEVSITKQLINTYEQHETSLIAIQESSEVEDLSSYGVVDVGEEQEKGLFTFDDIVEKPEPEDLHGNYATIGRYILEPEIFTYLETQEPGVDNQIQLTDAIERMNKDKEAYAYLFDGKRYDVGDLEGYMEANILFGLDHPETEAELRDYILDYADKNK
jgi:UTP--glucose-1-phosphate uridylyltransferase